MRVTKKRFLVTLFLFLREGEGGEASGSLRRRDSVPQVFDLLHSGPSHFISPPVPITGKRSSARAISQANPALAADAALWRQRPASRNLSPAGPSRYTCPRVDKPAAADCPTLFFSFSAFAVIYFLILCAVATNPNSTLTFLFDFRRKRLKP